MKTKLISKSSKDLIVFLSGWGCDDVQFAQMTSYAKDVLLCWDYSDIEFSFDFSDYENIDLIAYSAGVFIAGVLKNKLPSFRRKIAINGNPLMFDSYYGIPQNLLELFKKLNIDNYMNFRREYLVFNDEELQKFNDNASQRTFESCSFELDKLEEYSKINHSLMNFDISILSDSDKIFNPKHQQEYFEGRYLLLNNHAHNVFATFTNYDDIIKFVDNNQHSKL